MAVGTAMVIITIIFIVVVLVVVVTVLLLLMLSLSYCYYLPGHESSRKASVFKKNQHSLILTFLIIRQCQLSSSAENVEMQSYH